MSHRVLLFQGDRSFGDSLSELIRAEGTSWDIHAVHDSIPAFACLEREQFDFVVADKRLPNLDGLYFLQESQKRLPGATRLLLMDTPHGKDVLASVQTVHQVLKKPCAPEQLYQTLVRCADVRNLLDGTLLKPIVGRISSLPSAPHVYSRLNQCLIDPNVSFDEIAAVIQKDVALSARLLQIVNSPFFGLPRRMSSISSAVSFLGTVMIKNLALTVEVFQGFKNTKGSSLFSLESFEDHSLMTAHVAMSLVTERSEMDTAFTAGMLHDIGKLILATHMTDAFEFILQEAKKGDRPLATVEKETLGVTHGEIGAYLLGNWGLAYPVVEAVAYHHTPQRIPHHHFEILDAVYVANQLVHQHDPVPKRSPQETLDTEYLGRLGKADLLPDWQEYVSDRFNGLSTF